MTFTSTIFLIGLLPWFVILLFLTRRLQKSKIILIMLSNAIFYIFGGIGSFIFICCFSLVIWIMCRLVQRFSSKGILALSIFIAILPLLTVKYMGFLIDNINATMGCSLTKLELIAPVGVSFFSFEAVSLLCDCYRVKFGNKVTILNVFCYLTFFPTVTSGPIVRYQDFYKGLYSEIDFEIYEEAIERIIIGLSKKLLIADKVGVLADYFFDGVANGNTYSVAGLWTGSIAYTLQLFYDFSGYSDMAIGIGRLLGFHICENFNKPYQAVSISDFWKRWHITLSQWFRDYVYIPLGGNRCTAARHIWNLLVVWILTGIWHGADWSFVVWGVGYFILLVLEKYISFFINIGKHWYGHLYALFFVNLLWIPFRAESLTVAGKYIKGMIGLNGIGEVEDKIFLFLPLLLVAVLLCLPLYKIREKYFDHGFRLLHKACIVLLSILVICAAINASYAPYIYGNF